jgi:DNA-binding LacI/PurR family transcriptional regulator/DNA-binding transcriptional regulator YhcF (GntR family)
MAAKRSPYRKPQLERSIDFLMRLISRKDAGAQLPGYRALASQAGVSKDTMYKAIVALKQKELLFSDKEHRIRIGPNRPSSDSSATHGLAPELARHSWNYVRQRLEHDILNRLIGTSDELPSAKELCDRYGASHKTVNKALRALCADNIITRYKRTFRIAPPVPRAPSARVVCIGYGVGGSMRFGSHDSLLVHELEMSASRMNLELMICYFNNENGRIRFSLEGDESPVDITTFDPFGIIYFATFHQCIDRNMFQFLQQMKKPVAVLDQTGEPQLESVLPSTGQFRIFRMTVSKEPARQIARFLLGLGHTRIGFASPFNNMIWSLMRLAGLKEQYAKAGHESGIVAICCGEETDERRRVREQFKADMKKMRAQINAILSDVPLAHRQTIEWALNDEYTDGVFRMHYWWHVIEPDIEEALARKDVTAWVLTSDDFLPLFLECVRKANLKVPDDISIACFDDLLVAKTHGITSYNFNHPGVINAMLSYALAPDRYSTLGNKPVIEIEGKIMARRSTRKAAKA